MIPLGDIDRKPVRAPVVTGAIIAINLYAFVLEFLFGAPFIFRWSYIPAEITAGADLITLLTAMFMHAGLLHIAGNMIFLWAFAPEIEDAMGRFRFLVFYLAGGLVASLAQIIMIPQSDVPNLGASGAIAADKLAKLPDATGAVFPSLDQLNAASKTITEKWDAVVGVA